MLKLFVIAAMALATSTTVAPAQGRQDTPRPAPRRQPETEKALPTPDDIARWMNETIGRILDPVETIVNPKTP